MRGAPGKTENPTGPRAGAGLPKALGHGVLDLRGAPRRRRLLGDHRPRAGARSNEEGTTPILDRVKRAVRIMHTRECTLTSKGCSMQNRACRVPSGQEWRRGAESAGGCVACRPSDGVPAEGAKSPNTEKRPTARKLERLPHLAEEAQVVPGVLVPIRPRSRLGVRDSGRDSSKRTSQI